MSAFCGSSGKMGLISFYWLHPEYIFQFLQIGRPFILVAHPLTDYENIHFTLPLGHSPLLATDF
jgi:hypothetical protein